MFHTVLRYVRWHWHIKRTKNCYLCFILAKLFLCLHLFSLLVLFLTIKKTGICFPFKFWYCAIVVLSHSRIFFRKLFSSTWIEGRQDTDFKYSSVNRCLWFCLCLPSPWFPAKAVGEASEEITGRFPISGWNVPPFRKVTRQVRKQSHQFQTM